MKRILLKFVLPWLITIVALYLAFNQTSWEMLKSHIWEVKPGYLCVAVGLTILSYILRALRWPLLFPENALPFGSSYRVLVLGFFMNNVLPARAGELVRAHLGSKVLGKQRTLVLATIASERLADGLAISLMFVVIMMGFGRGHLAAEHADKLMWFAYLFGGVALAVIAVLLLRNKIFAITDRAALRFSHNASTYTLSRVQTFIHGLSPLSSPSRAIKIALWSLVIWGVELGVFACVSAAYSSGMPLAGVVLFLVAANFSSLIPAAPGGIGVIEFAVLTVLSSAHFASEDLAFCMATTQHLIQYIVIGIPGAFILSNLRSQLKDMSDDSQSIDASTASPREVA